MNSENTREKILRIAGKLFGEKGYDAASIREIAKEADVNVAAINYHFKNKQALYWEVTIQSHLWLEEDVRKTVEAVTSIEEFVFALFDSLIKQSSDLQNAFRMFVSTSTPDIEEETREKLNDQEDCGPPGAQYVISLLDKELGDSVSIEAKKWAMKNIFTGVLHWALIFGNSNCREIHKDDPDFQEDSVKDFLKHMTRSTLQYAKSSSTVWTP